MNPKPASTTAAVANFFIEKAHGIGGLTPMKLGGLIYFAHGWHLAKNDQPLIDETAEVRDFGIAIPSIFRCTCGHDYLRHPIKDERGFQKLPRVEDPNLLAFLEQVWDRLWKYDQVYLARLSNNGTCWKHFMKEVMVDEGSSVITKNKKSPPDVTHDRFFGENLERVIYALRGS